MLLLCAAAGASSDAKVAREGEAGQKKDTLLDLCVSSLRRGHANLLCIVPILVYVLPKQVHLEKENI